MKVLATKSSFGSNAGSIKGLFDSPTRCKFVIGQKDGAYVLALTPSYGGPYHSQVANNMLNAGFGVVGGGRISISPPTIPMMYWDSKSMREAFEYDRPEDESLLDGIKEQLERDLAAD